MRFGFLAPLKKPSKKLVYNITCKPHNLHIVQKAGQHRLDLLKRF